MSVMHDFKSWLRSAPRIRNPFAAPVVHVVYRVAGLHGTYCYKCKLGTVGNRYKLQCEIARHRVATNLYMPVGAPIIEIVEIF
jgi:hypothetical protein